MTESPGNARLRKLFLDVKFSKKDAANVEKRISNTRIRHLRGDDLKRAGHGLSRTQFEAFVAEARTELNLGQEAVDRLLQVGQSEAAPGGVLEEVVELRLFGYVAAVRDDADGEAAFDAVFVAHKAHFDWKPSPMDCFSTTSQKNLREKYAEALVLNYCRVKVVEQLRIEGLTTRGQHQRKDRFKPKSHNAAAGVHDDNDDDDDDDDSSSAHHDS